MGTVTMTVICSGSPSGLSGSSRSMTTGMSTWSASGSSSRFFLICSSTSLAMSSGVLGSSVSPIFTMRSPGLIGLGLSGSGLGSASGLEGSEGSGFLASSSGESGVTLSTGTPGFTGSVGGLGVGSTRSPPRISSTSLTGSLGSAGLGSEVVGSAAAVTLSTGLPSLSRRLSQSNWSLFTP